MKTTLKFLFVAALLLTGMSVSAQQNAKLGYTNMQAIISELPDMAEVQKNWTAFVEELQKQGQALENEYTSLAQDYQKKANSYTDAIRVEKENELQNLRDRLSQFEQKYREDASNKESELMEPVFVKVRVAIESIAKTGGYAYIFDASNILYVNPALATDVTPELKKELGL